MITRNFNLFLNAGKHIPLVINVNQYDHDEQWCFTLLNDNGEKYLPSTGAIVGIKADRLGIINSGTVNASGQVVINETEQMTAAVGKAVFELLIDDQTHGTANFAVLVEPKPGNNADFSESDLSLLQEAIDGTSAAAIAQGVSDWMDDNLTPTTPVVDASLTVQGAAADAKKTGDEISDLKSQIEQGTGLTDEAKEALLGFLEHVITDSEQADDMLQELREALYPIHVVSINAVFVQGNRTIFSNASLDSLKEFLTVTATYSDGSTQTVDSADYELTGELAAGTSVITVSYSDVTGTATDTFNVTVTSFALPEGYTQYGYIQKKTTSENKVTRSNFILLNTYDDLNELSLELTFGQKSSTAYSPATLGARMGSTTASSFSVYNNSGGLYVYVRGRYCQVTSSLISDRSKLEIINPANSPVYCRINGGNLKEFEWTDPAEVITCPIMLFNSAPYTDTTTSYSLQQQSRIGDIILRKADGECVGYYVPVTYNGVIGMYDIVSETFYTAETTTVVTVANSGCLYAVGNWA